MKILSFGEILWDVYPKTKAIGGAALNFGAHLRRHGAEVYMLSSLGNDALGREARLWLAENGMPDTFVEASKNPTGACLVTLGENKIPSYDLLADVAWDQINAPKKLDPDFDVLYFGTLAQRSAHNKKTLITLLENYSFREIFVDMNVRAPHTTADSIRFATEHATILKISDEELPTVKAALGIPESLDDKEAISALAAEHKNLKIILLTLGERGACALYDGNFFEVSAEAATPISTVGAGDSFSAAFIYKYLLGERIEAAMRYAAKISAFVVSSVDAVPKYSPSDFNG